MANSKVKEAEIQHHIVPRVVRIGDNDVYYEKYKLVDGVEYAVLENGKEVKTDNAVQEPQTSEQSAEPAEANPAE